MKSIYNYRIRLIGILIITVLRFGFTSSEVLAGHRPFSWSDTLTNLVGNFVMSVLIWEGSRLVVVYFNRRYPLGKISVRRFVVEALWVIVAAGVVYVFSMVIHFSLGIEAEVPYVYLMFGLLDRFLYGILIAAFYEMLLFMEAWKTATQEAEQLKKINLMVQLESLKNQVKPHFLFNSLNTLTGLVEKDQAQAVKFIAELAKVYRYLLQSNEKELIGLNQELLFTEAYFFLLQTRFGDGIDMTVEVPEPVQHYHIPPLTLQILVENAVKHNQVSARKPLRVQIRAEEGNWLVVQNNFQPKRNAVPSTGMGLANISAKYRLLSQPEVLILHDERHFTVKVPLIKPLPA